MRRGLFIAPFDELADAAVMTALAVRAEEKGWDGLFVWDHVQYPEEVWGVGDAWTMLATIAAATATMRIGPLVTPLARRHPWIVARQAVAIDRLSGGRLVLGFGVGGDSNGEMAEFGEEGDMRRRAEMLDEGLELLGELLSGDPVDHQGRHYAVRARPFLPRALQAPRIPVWMGVRRWASEAPAERAARWDGVFPLDLGPGEVGDLRERMAGLRTVGAAPSTIVAVDRPDFDVDAWTAAEPDWLLTTLGPTPLPGGAPAAMLSASAVETVIDAGPRLS